MPIFTYTTRNAQGLRQNGVVEAQDEEAAAKTIARDGWFIVSLSAHTAKSSWSLFPTRVMSAMERIVFTDHLGEMIASGTPIVEALETYQEEENKKITIILRDIISSVQRGKKLSQALEAYPKIFTPYYVALVSAGELTGRLDESFLYIARELRREYEFKERIKSALLYPSLVVVVAAIVILFLVFFVIPKITELTKSFGGDLPIATKIVSGAASLITQYGGWFMASIAILIAVFISLLRNPKTRADLDPYILKLPIIGSIMRQYTLARFLRIIGSCLQYGIPLGRAFESATGVVGNSVYKKASLRLKARITKGMSVANSLSAEDPFYFPSFLIRSIRGAEKTGSLDKVLLRISSFYEGEVDRNLHRLTELIQPILTVILGLVVGAIAISVVAPIYQITSKIR